MNTLTIKLPEALERQIAQVARRRRITKSELVRRAAEQYVARDAESGAFRSAADLAGNLAGSIKNTPSDLASDPRHLEDYGR